MGSNSLGSSHLLNWSGSESDLQVLLDERKRRRMKSNRESAKRSRMREQDYLNDLTAEAKQLREENNQIQGSINATKQELLNLEAENSVLKVQMMELQLRLVSLQDMVRSIDACSDLFLAKDISSYSSFPRHSDCNTHGSHGAPLNNIMYPNQPTFPSNCLLRARL